MLQIHMSQLSMEDRERLQAEMVQAMLMEMRYPPNVDYQNATLRMRPLSKLDRQHAKEFITAARLDDLETVMITSSVLRDRLIEILVRYQESVTPDDAEMQRRMTPARLLAPRLASEMQRRLVAYVLDNADNHFGEPGTRLSWQDSNNAAPLGAPREMLAQRAVELANALATIREETPPAQQAVTSVADLATNRIPVVERAAMPLPAVAPAPPTAPLPQPAEIPQEMARPRGDRTIFLHLREQLLAAMMTAGKSYGLQLTPADPAGLLAALRMHDMIDEVDLRLAEGILALCGRVIAEDRASIDDYRQALTLYLLFNRRRLGSAHDR